MKKNFKLYIGLALIGLASSCAPSLDEFEPSKGTADFSKFIAVGNSLTSGYADNGLYLEGQKVAFPNLIAEQLKEVGGGEFTSPFFSQDQENGSGYIKFGGFDTNGNPVMEPVTDKLAVRGLNPDGKPLYTKYTDPIQNLGVPGMRLDMSMAPGVGTVMGNPYFERLLPEGTPATLKYVEYAASHEHTFFTFWLGNNDVLGYATNGAAATEDATKKLLDLPTFEFAYNAFVKALVGTGAKGVVATIPDVTAIPVLNTLTTARLNAAVEAATQGQAKNVYIATKKGPRIATDADLFMLTFPTALLGQPNEAGFPYGIDPRNPIADNYVLDKDEVVEVSNRVKAFNEKIKAIAGANDLAVADVYTFLNKVKSGYNYNGVHISAAFITGNAFSLDGVHLTPMGNAIVANVFIDAINAKYNSKIGKIDVSQYRGVKFPN